MVLSDKTIQAYLDQGKIIILPGYDKKDIRPVGIRLHLGESMLVPVPGQTIDLGGDDSIQYDERRLSEGGYTLKPGDFILGATYERFQVPRDILCHIDGRSTLARLGLAIHCTSSTVDGNFDEPRSVVLEIKNTGPMNLILKPRISIGMLLFSELSHPIAQDSQKQYGGQDSVAPPTLGNQEL